MLSFAPLYERPWKQILNLFSFLKIRDFVINEMLRILNYRLVIITRGRDYKVQPN